MFDLHRHDEFSTFDGYGKARDLAKLAKEYGYTALSITNHGNTNSLVQTYKACQEVDIKAILGVEGYFLPKWKEKNRGTHLVLVAKNLVGYGNINRIQAEADKQKYYNPIWDFAILEKYSDGLICSSACVGGYFGQAVKAGNLKMAEKYLRKMKSIFGDDFYIEIQPYVVSEDGLQEMVNLAGLEFGEKLGIKCILTSDSHYTKLEEFDTYLKMHEIAGHDTEEIAATYRDRYMPKMGDLEKRFVKMHGKDFGKEGAKKLAIKMIANVEELEAKCEKGYLSELPLQLPKVGGRRDTFVVIKNKVAKGLKDKGVWNAEYRARAQEELSVIREHGFADYFLIVADYVQWAKDNGISVGPGRGSVCNSLVAYALGITEVDSLHFNLDFRRFLRLDKKKVPDIDLDFETSRRKEVIDYLCTKYDGHAARIVSYGAYQVDNLINDLAKVSGLETDKEAVNANENKREVARIKKLVRQYVDEETNLDAEGLLNDSEAVYINKQYDNLLLHFTRLYKKTRFIGTHSAGVAITNGTLLDYVALRTDSNGDVFTAYDLADLEDVNVIKFDILGLKTMESVGDLRAVTNVTVEYKDVVNDEKTLLGFSEANTDGIFQLEKDTAKKILVGVGADCFDDVCATTALNRPGPLSLKMPEEYAQGKENPNTRSKIWPYTKETYGSVVYQEQIQQICINVGGMSWDDADRMMKLLKDNASSAEAIRKREEARAELEVKFLAGARKSGLGKREAEDIFRSMIVYSFNKGHAVGYTLISFEEMFYKVHYPNEFWYAKLKHARDEAEYDRFCAKAVKDGSIVFLPHVNYSNNGARLRRVDGANAIQQGLTEIKFVADKAADVIVSERKENGVFKSYDDFYDRCKNRLVTTRVITALYETGALEFDKKKYLNRVVKYNTALYGRG